MKILFSAFIGIAVVLTGCGVPPEYVANGVPTPVDVLDETCSAQLFDVTYSELTDLQLGEGPIERTTGTQFKVTCGTVTTNCTLNQSLDDCVAMIARMNRADDDDSSDGYSQTY
jgi:hypothetical protein